MEENESTDDAKDYPWDEKSNNHNEPTVEDNKYDNTGRDDNGYDDTECYNTGCDDDTYNNSANMLEIAQL